MGEWRYVKPYTASLRVSNNLMQDPAHAREDSVVQQNDGDVLTQRTVVTLPVGDMTSLLLV